MPMRQAALLTALAAAGQAAFDACGEPTKGPVLGGIDVVDAWAKALKARNATVSNQGPRLPHLAEAPPLRGSAEHAFTTPDGFALHFATEANRDAYAADPAKYALGAGGYCGLGASGRDPRCANGDHCRGPACGTSPLTFQVSGVDGKLYFFLGAGARQIFNEDEEASVAGAAAKVVEVEAATGRACFNTDLLGCRTPGSGISWSGGGNATRAGAWRQRLNQGFLGPGGMAGQRGPAPGGPQRPGMTMGDGQHPAGGQRPGMTGQQRPDGQQRPGGAAGGQQRPDGQRGPGATRGDGQRPGGPNGGQRPGQRGGGGDGGDGARQPAPKRKKTAWESVKAWIWGA
ncbi:unnamed protein product [Pelagomonas calceolata]|uniref:Uncharacterized protein n=1 Tax=Pelagomonas calceolata TaxID=35677 RepID=A0A8J2SJJ2_9STRA|nr:unnamed protein product [Pelagomonas calceolata]